MIEKCVRYKLVKYWNNDTVLDVDNSAVNLDDDSLLGSFVLESKIYLLYKNGHLVAKLTPDKRTFLYLFRDYWLMSDEELDMTTEIDEAGVNRIVGCMFCNNPAKMTIIYKKHTTCTGEYDDASVPTVKTRTLAGYQVYCTYCGYKDEEQPV